MISCCAPKQTLKAGTIFSSYVYTRSTTASSWSSHVTVRARCSELQHLSFLQFLSLTCRSPLFRNRFLCQCSPGQPFLLQGERVTRAETQTRGIISSAAHKTNLFTFSGFAHLPAPLRSSSPTALCTSHHSTMFYFLPVFPTSPQEFATMPRSIPVSHQCTLLSTKCSHSMALGGWCLFIWHSRLPAQVTAFQQLLDRAEQTTSLLCPSFLGWGH